MAWKGSLHLKTEWMIAATCLRQLALSQCICSVCLYSSVRYVGLAGGQRRSFMWIGLPVDPAYERVRSKETNCTCEEAVYKAGEEAVREEQHAGDESRDAKLEKVIPRAGQENPEGRTAAYEERLPPPVIVLQSMSIGCSRTA